MLITLLQIIHFLLGVAMTVMFIYVIMSWLITFQVLNLRQPLVAGIWDGLNRLLQPIFEPVRRFLPNTGMLDLSPLVVFLGIIILRDIIIRNMMIAL